MKKFRFTLIKKSVSALLSENKKMCDYTFKKIRKSIVNRQVREYNVLYR